MQNPALFEYKRGCKLAAVFVVMLSFLAALCHFLLTIDNRLSYTEQRLGLKAAQLDSHVLPLVQLADWYSKVALANQASQLADRPLPLYDQAGNRLTLNQAQALGVATTAELAQLQQFNVAFAAVQVMQPAVERVLYVSDSGFVYFNHEQSALLQLEKLAAWFNKREANTESEHNGLTSFAIANNKALLSQRIKQGRDGVGYLLFMLDVPTLLSPLQQQTPDANFLLLDDNGQLLGGTTDKTVETSELVMQLQRIGNQALSLVMLEQRNGLFNAGIESFLFYWIDYLLVLSIAAAAFCYRFKQKVVSPVKRLTIHVERIVRDQGGVRHIPGGWEEIFDKISRLKP